MNSSWLLRLLCLVLSLLTASAQAAGKPDLFNQGLAAISARDWQALAKVQQQLGDHYPLNAYLEYAQLHQQLDDSTPGQITTFRNDYRDTPLANRLLSEAIAAYARSERWQELLQLTSTPPNSLSLRCDYVMAQVQTGVPADKEVASLLQRSTALPGSCRDLFALLADGGKLDRDTLLLLMHNAFRQGQGTWLTQLGGWLPDSNREKEWLLKLYQSPDQLDGIPARLAARQSLYALALTRLAQRDPVAALASWQQAPATLFVDANEQQQLAARLAWYSAISSDQVNRDWLDGWLENHTDRAPSALEQRARHAVMEQDWKGVVRWVSKLAPGKLDAQWQYWLARAQTGLGQAEAGRRAMEQAASERTFYGFLAARALQQPVQLDDKTPDRHEQLHLSDTQMATLARVRLLLAAGQERDARSEWQYLLGQVSERDYPALARYALSRHWYHFAIATAIHSGGHDRLAWRFPLAWREDFRKAAKVAGADDAYLMMAVARRESAFFPAAQSPVGAVGLMQLMPATAKQVAKDLGLSLANDGLLDPATNMTLGSDYLGGLLERYQGNRVLALAAYNAGPSRVDQWLGNTSVPFDVWIESIPYAETRAYVKAVLAYRVIFMRRAGIADADIDMLGKVARHFAYTSAALAEQKTSVKLSDNP